MSESELLEIGKLLNLKWPGKYAVDDIELWMRRLTNYEFDAVHSAIFQWRNGAKGHMPPKIDEIEKLVLANFPPTVNCARRRYAIDQSVIDANPAHSNRTDPELRMIYYRGEYRRIERQVETFERISGRPRSEIDIDRLDRHRRLVQQRCAEDLISHFGFDVASAMALAARVHASASEFIDALGDARRVLAGERFDPHQLRLKTAAASAPEGGDCIGQTQTTVKENDEVEGQAQVIA